MLLVLLHVFDANSCVPKSSIGIIIFYMFVYSMYLLYSVVLYILLANYALCVCKSAQCHACVSHLYVKARILTVYRLLYQDSLLTLITCIHIFVESGKERTQKVCTNANLIYCY